jgi:glycerophosphoryl diester phosphodiesterase
MLVFVEIKTLAPQFDARLLEVLAGGPNPAGYAIHSFDHRIVRRVGTAQASLRRGVLSGSYAIRPTIAMEDAGAKDLWQEQSLVDSSLVAAVHRAGGRVIAWTANTAERMRELIQLGVDGICTNYPDVARRAVDQLAA